MNEKSHLILYLIHIRFLFFNDKEDQDSAYILLEDFFRADALEFNRQESLKKLLVPIQKNAGNKLGTFKDCLPTCAKIMKQEEIVYKKFDLINEEEHFEKLMNAMVQFLKENCGEFLKDEKVPLLKMVSFFKFFKTIKTQGDLFKNIKSGLPTLNG